MTQIKFGTDGWRGVIAKDFTFPNVRIVAQAVADYMKDPLSKFALSLGGSKKNKLSSTQVLVGYDHRFQSEAFAMEAARVLEANGVLTQVSDAAVPSPLLSFSVKDRRAALGLMITASHNPYLYNGLKIKTSHGTSAGDDVTKDLEALIGRTPAKTHGPEPKRAPLIPSYIKHLKSSLDRSVKSGRGAILVDALYGCGAGLLEQILPPSYKVTTLHSERDPLFGNINPEPIEKNLSDLQAAMRSSKALLGLALDGDADRLGVVDDTGHYLPPHQVFPLMLYYLAEIKKQKGKVVQAVSLGYLSERIAKANGCPWEEVPVGFKHVSQRMLAEDILLGGEESGGYAFRGGLPERDGVRCGLLLLEMVVKTGKKISQLLLQMEKKYGASRYGREDVPLPTKNLDKTKFTESVKAKVPKTLVGQKIRELRDKDGLKIVLENDAWVLLRPSGTEPVVRLYAETEDPAKTRELILWAKQVSERAVKH